MKAELLTLSILLVHVSGFAIRTPRLARSASGVDENSLSDALRVLEREKRRLDNEASYRDWEPGYYGNWNDDDDAALDDEVDDLGEDFDLEDDDDGVSSDIAEYLANLLTREEADSQYLGEPDMGEIDAEAMTEARAEKEEPEINVFSPQRVSIEELQDIFNDDKLPETSKRISLKSKKLAMRKKKTPEVENSLLGDRERMTETLKADKEKNKAAKKKKSISRNNIDLKHLSRSQIQELLNEVDKIEKQEVLERENSNKDQSFEAENTEDVEGSDSNIEPVTEEELADILGDDDDEGDEGGEEEENSEVENFENDDGDEGEEAEDFEDTDDDTILPEGEEINDELLSRDIYSRPDARKKRVAKRNYKGSSSGNKNRHYSAEISRLLEIIGKLRLKNLMENKEIDNLADALDVATNSQTRQSLEGLPKELKSLQRAIKIEESLQGENSELSPEDEQYLRDVIEELINQGNGDDSNDEEEEQSYAREETEKRSGAEEFVNDSDEKAEEAPTFADRMGQWYEEPIVSRKPMDHDLRDASDLTDQDIAEKLEEEEENEEANQILEDLIDRYRADEVLASEPEVEEDDDTDEEAEVEDLYPAVESRLEEEERSPSSTYQDALARLFRDEAVDEATQREIEQALAQFQHNVEPWQRRELENRVRAYEQCSPLDNIVSDCRLADELNIPIDDEARELCSRHEACYTCGMVLGKAAGQCDAGYLAEAFQLCDGAEKCNLKADAFLRLLQYYHRYSAAVNGACEHQCVVDYIYGVTL
ncbi:protein PFC0760c-like [Liolophura sinensis]|uniref:protein PFC0760c-like n=1 Tax=Liolophura sinensis TaxID=3198878 RepID=UPI0031581E0E